MRFTPTLSLIAVASLLSACASGPSTQQTDNPAIDYAGFAALVDELGEYRSQRLIDLNTFLQYAEASDTIVLGARSADAYARGHIDGAVNLPFSDFTQAKLDKLLGDKSKRVLIYCNNNFSDDLEPVPLKRVELALNIPTFINLFGYGYENIYELEDVLSIEDERIRFVSGP